MKVLCEVTNQSPDGRQPEFNWLKNLLLIVDDSKKIRLLDVTKDPANELKLANIEGGKSCTDYSWNRDTSLLSIVIDTNQLYIWSIEANVFTHIKSANRYAIDHVNRKQRLKEITAVKWSQLTNKLVICYATGQLLLCWFSNSSVSERFIDNSEGLLKKILSVETSETSDIFACISVTNEVLVMTFDGQSILYFQSECPVTKIKFSKSYRVQEVNIEGSPSVVTKTWLTCRSGNQQLLFKLLQFGKNIATNDAAKQLNFFFDASKEEVLVDFFWLDESRLINCYTTGRVELLEFQYLDSSGQDDSSFKLVSSEIRDVSIGNLNEEQNTGQNFKVYTYLNTGGESQTTSSFCNASMICLTDHLIRYYKVHKNYQSQISIERVDEMDMSDNLRCIDQVLTNAKWSHDGSMIALQLKNGHLLVYRASLSNYLVAIQGSKVAYVSDAEEITVLNYGPSESNGVSDTSQEIADLKPKEPNADSDRKSPSSNTIAQVLNVNFKPSLLAIGNKYLAVALNNRLRFYHIDGSNEIPFEEEYPTIISSVSLSSSFVATHLKDGRLRLQAINLIKSGRSSSPIDDMLTVSRSDERYFPDPLSPETIVAVTLTESLLIYSSLKCRLTLFCLHQWMPIQTYDHKPLFTKPIQKLVANGKGNKLSCLLNISQSGATNVYLYDIYTNAMSPITDNRDETERFLSKRPTTDSEKPEVPILNKSLLRGNTSGKSVDAEAERLNRVSDVMWDTDGRSFLLMEQHYIHIITSLDHTAFQNGPLTFYVGKVDKPPSCTSLYASQGIVSFQTCLGRVINTILSPYDDELQLTHLEQKIQQIMNSDAMKAEKIEKVTRSKLQYLTTILPIYSLSRCKEICKYLMTEEQFNIEQDDLSTQSPIWKRLATWALFTMHLDFAQMIYRKYGFVAQACMLDDIQRLSELSSVDLVRKRINLLLSL